MTWRALEALALRLDGTRAAATTITRKRAVFHGCLSYAAEPGLLEANPPDHATWRRAIAGQRRAWVHRPAPSPALPDPGLPLPPTDDSPR